MTLTPRMALMGGGALAVALLGSVWLLRGRPEAPSGPEASLRRRHAPAPSDVAVESRPAVPASAVGAAEGGAGPGTQPTGGTSAPRVPTRERDRRTWEGQVVDASAAPRDRLEAARRLARASQLDRVPGAMASLALLLKTCPDEGVRAALCGLLAGRPDPEWRRQVLASAQTDASPRVRAAAVAALAPLPDDPAVLALLRQAEARESDAGVQREYRRLLGRRP
jgi:hypothetical protein